MMRFVGYSFLLVWGFFAVYGLYRTFKEGIAPKSKGGDDNAP